MRHNDNDFNNLYCKYEPNMDSGGEDVNPMTTYRNVLRKAGLEPRRREPKRVSKVFLIAAILAVGTLSVAAAVYSASDAFRGVLKIHGGSSVSAADAIVDRTGAVVRETKESGTVDFSLRAVVGDTRRLQVLVDVTDRSGKGLALRQSDGKKSGGLYSLGAYSLTKADGAPLAGSGNYSFVDLDPAKGKFTILFDYGITSEEIRGKTLKLHFEDIFQEADLQGTALQMGKNDLYELVKAFGPYEDKDFRLSGVTEAGTTDLLHTTSSGKGRPLCKEYPGITVTGAAVKDGALYLQGTADQAAQADRVLEHAALYRDGAQTATASETSRGTGTAWAIRFDGIESTESLKGLVWRFGAGESTHVAYKGSWDFTFQADIQDLAVKLTPNLTTTWEGYDLTVTALELSPYSLFLGYSTDQKSALGMFPPVEWGTMQTSDWIESYHPITLTMKDGSTVKVEGGSLTPKGGNLAMVPTGTVITDYVMLYDMAVVIDPAQVASVQIGSRTIPVSP